MRRWPSSSYDSLADEPARSPCAATRLVEARGLGLRRRWLPARRRAARRRRVVLGQLDPAGAGPGVARDPGRRHQPPRPTTSDGSASTDVRGPLRLRVTTAIGRGRAHARGSPGDAADRAPSRRGALVGADAHEGERRRIVGPTRRRRRAPRWAAEPRRSRSWSGDHQRRGGRRRAPAAPAPPPTPPRGRAARRPCRAARRPAAPRATAASHAGRTSVSGAGAEPLELVDASAARRRAGARRTAGRRSGTCRGRPGGRGRRRSSAPCTSAAVAAAPRRTRAPG